MIIVAIAVLLIAAFALCIYIAYIIGLVKGFGNCYKALKECGIIKSASEREIPAEQ